MKRNYPIRKTARLVLRHLAPADFEIWKAAHLAMGKARNKWDLGPRPKEKLAKTEYKKLLKVQADRTAEDWFYNFGVFHEDRFIGEVTLMEVARGISYTAFLGYRIFNPYWGKGFAKEAVRAAIDIGFNEVKLHRIEAGIEPGNLRSIGLAKSLGMRHEGTKKRALFLRQRWVDLLMFTVTTEDLGYKFKGKFK